MLPVLSPTRCRSLSWGSKGQMTEQHPRCPVASCRVRRDKLSKRGGSIRRWYSVDSNRHLLTGLLDSNLAALPGNDHICPNCYKRIRRLPLPARNLLDELTAAAEEQHPTSSPPPSPQTQSPSPPPPPPPSPASSPPFPQPPLSLSPSQYPPNHQPSAANALPVRRALSDITNHTSSRHHHSTLKRKQQLLRAASTATTSQERAAVLCKAGIAPHNHGRYLTRYEQQLATNAASPKTEKQPQTAKRLSGGGRKTALTAEQEAELRAWVMEQRRSEARLAVSEKMVRMEAKRRWGISASSKWVRGWMERQRLCMRLRTTHKEIDTERMREVKQQYQYKMARLFNTVNHHLIFNVDETAVFFDAPHHRTIDEIGARNVEIGHTEHYADRISVVLCISCSGRMLPPLVVHTCNETTEFKKTGTFTFQTFNTSAGGEAVPSVDMWITHRSKGWLDSEMMCVWLEHVFGQGVAMFDYNVSDTVLFMDGCSAHHTPECEGVARRLGIQVECLPPNCTPILQPCDQYVNALFKQYYQDEWYKWYKLRGSKQHTKPGNKHSRLRKATEAEVNQWIANAAARLIASSSAIRASWRDTLLSPPHVMRLPDSAWARFGQYGSPCTFTALSDRRSDYDGSRYDFPVTQRRKRKAEVAGDENQSVKKQLRPVNVVQPAWMRV